MARPTSFRLSQALLESLDAEATASGVSVTALVTALLDEGLKTRRFPGTVYRDGPTGRRAALAGGPDVWEVVRTVKQTAGPAEHRIRTVAQERSIPLDQVRLAVDFYVAFPAEIDARITADATAAKEAHDLIARRDRLISS